MKERSRISPPLVRSEERPKTERKPPQRNAVRTELALSHSPPAPLPLLPHSSAASGPSRAHGPAESEAITKVMGEDVVRGRKKTNCERLSPKLEFLPLARLARLPVVRSIQEWRALTVSRGPPFFSAPVLSASASFLLGGRCQRTSSSTMNSGRCGVHPSGPPREERRGGKGGCDTRAHPNARWRAGDRT